MAHEAACLVARDGVLVPSRDARRKLRRDGDGTGIAAGPRALLAQQRDASPQLGKRLPSRDPPVAETRCALDPATQPAGFADLPAACPYLKQTQLTGQGVHVLYAASIDRAGNAGDVERVEWKLDATPPSLACSVTASNGIGSSTATSSSG